MFSQTNRGEIKNAKILSWRLDLSQLHYDIRHKPIVYNVAPDALSRSCVLAPCMPLRQVHQSLGHPGYARVSTLFANAICLTPARRQKLYVDRAELALKLSRVFIAACSDSDKDFTTMGPSKSRYQRPGEG